MCNITWSSRPTKFPAYLAEIVNQSAYEVLGDVVFAASPVHVRLLQSTWQLQGEAPSTQPLPARYRSLTDLVHTQQQLNH